MCGIAGLLATRPVNPAAVGAMTARMAHRGPDDYGLWASPDGRVALGHRRLSIIDTSPAGHQPMEADGLAIVFNGEIYNYLELRQELAALGEAFRSQSDTEVLLAGWRRWGEGLVDRLNGMFAFALVDQRQRLLFAARDRFGEKPFLFAQSPGLFAFASEYKALLALAEVPGEWSPLPLARFSWRPSQGLDDARETLFPAIRQLLPGECMTVALDTLAARTRRYWQPGPVPEHQGLSPAGAAERLRDLLEDSVRLRLRSDVPVGSCLSGGLDSSAIVCLARRLLGEGKEYHVFTGRFPGTPADEWAHAEQVIRAVGATSHVVEPRPERFLEELPEFLWLNELPVGSSSQYAQWCVFRLAREAGVTVLLDGQGADEILGGYEQYFQPYLASLPEAERAAEEAAIRERYPAALDNPRQALSKRLPGGLRRRLGAISGRGSDVLFGLAPELARRVEKTPPAPLDAAGLHPLAAALKRDAFAAFLPVLLRYGDRNSMAHSREVRLPFLDHRIVELSLSLPPGHLMGGAQTKRLLRDAMAGILPEPIRTRWNKQGFLPPQDLWFAGPLLAEAERMVEDPGFAASGLWHTRWWRAALKRLKAGEKHLAWPLWRPLMAEAWRRHFAQRAAGMPKISAFG